MRSLGGFVYDRRWWAIGAWVVILLALTGAARVIGPDYEFDVDLGGTESVTALDLLAEHDPAYDGSALTIAWESGRGVTDPAAKQTVSDLLSDFAGFAHVTEVGDPFSNPIAAATQVSKDGTVAYATVLLDTRYPTDAEISSMIAAVERVNEQNDDLSIGITGTPIKSSAPPTSSVGEVLGFVIAAVILLLAFGSLFAAGLPIATALVALGASLAIVEMATHVVAIPSFSPQLVSLISIGVGIDYALFVVSRHRAGLMQGMEVRESVLNAFDTSGRAVVVAGLTVMISILGMMATGITFLNGLAIATSIGVLSTLLVTLTLLPALLALLGRRVLGRRAQRDLRANGPQDLERSTRWGAWAQMIQRRPWPFIMAAVLLLVALCVPAASMRMAMADSGAEPAGTTMRIAFDAMSRGFGPGANGPLLLVSTDQEALSSSVSGVAGLPGVASVSPVQATADGAVFTAYVFPVGSPQDASTSELIAMLRDGGVADDVLVSGVTAVYDDFSSRLQSRLPWFLAGVLVLSSILLLVAFRSLAIPIKAAVMNLLAAGATFGVLVMVLQWGWFGPLLGFESPGPVDSTLPILLVAILFGLSMDYQVFLVARMREEWLRSRDNTHAVTVGLSETGRVITAAALIMIAVFGSFMFGSVRIIKVMGLGMAFAIFLDAFVIRSLLVPALMQVLGDWNWWLPRWLARITPRVSLEPARSEGAHVDS